MKEKLRVNISFDTVFLQNRYIDVEFPKRSILFSKMQLQDGDFVEISLKKVKKRR